MCNRLILSPCKRFAQDACECFQESSKNGLKFPKFHAGSHYADDTRLYGKPDTADGFERAHKYHCKCPYRLTNKNATFIIQVSTRVASRAHV